MLDIGCGTGILSIFAARAGAKHVYAVENAEIALFAKEIIKQNGLSNKITVLKGKMEEINLPVKKVDIILSEWMGYFLLYESMLDTVLWARDKYLAPGGKILPDKCTMYVAGIEDAQFKEEKRAFWEDVYGVNMTCLQKVVMFDPIIDTVPADIIMTDSCKILQLDLTTMKPNDVEFSSKYCLNASQNETMHAMLSWWDCEFSRLENPQILSTKP